LTAIKKPIYLNSKKLNNFFEVYFSLDLFCRPTQKREAKIPRFAG
jgi:hypothetical protein